MAESNDGMGEGQSELAHLVGRYLVFRLDDVNYGLKVTAVQEIVQMMDITKIPKAPEYVRGILSLRGKTIPAIELRKQFKLAALEDSDKTCIIVVEVPSSKGGYRAGIIVDEVAEVLDLDEEHLAGAPELGQEERARFVKALGVVDGNITVLLDIEKLLSFDEFDLSEMESGQEGAPQPPGGADGKDAPAESGDATGGSPAGAPEADSIGGLAGANGDENAPGLVRHISTLLQQMRKGSPEYEATAEMLIKIQEFFQVMQKAEGQELDSMLLEFDGADQPLLQELGRLVRRFHTEIKSVGSDISRRLGKIVEHDMGGATQRLEHIVEMTESAANTTMNLAEGMIGALTKQTAGDEELLKKLERAAAAKKNTPATKKLLKEAAEAIEAKAESGKEQQGHLNEILMAQAYQDLTGQVVQKIVTLLDQLEGELLALVEAFGTAQEEKGGEAETAASGRLVLEGPLSEKSEIKKSQDEVDDLLGSLGF